MTTYDETTPIAWDNHPECFTDEDLMRARDAQREVGGLIEWLDCFNADTDDPADEERAQHLTRLLADIAARASEAVRDRLIAEMVARAEAREDVR